MNGPSIPSPAEAGVAAEVAACLGRLAIGDEVGPHECSDLGAYLERFVPEVLSRTYAEWSGESLDGVLVARATKVADFRLRLLGHAILITDQRVTPLLVEPQASPTSRVVEHCRIQIGESGIGPLGVSGPLCTSSAASRLLHRLVAREARNQVGWVYVATHDRCVS